MIYICYIIVGIIVFGSVEFLSINIGGLIGSGPNEIGIVVSALSILCSIIVLCTIIIVDAIKNNRESK